MNKLLLLCLFIVFGQAAKAQEEQKAPIKYKSWDFQVAYGIQNPLGELANRFGYNLNVSGGLRHRWADNRYFAGVEGYYIFGRRVKENPAAWLYNEDGYIFGWSADGGFEVPLLLRERGFYVGINGGRLFALNQRRIYYLRANIGVGFLQHKIHYVDDSRSLAQLFGDYGKGLDRLTYGWASHQELAFEHISPKNRFNYFLALEITEGLTRNRRSFNYDTLMRDDHLRLDLLVGLRFGYFFAYYYGSSDELIFY